MADDVVQIQVKINAETGQLELVSQKLMETGKSAKQADDSFFHLGETGKDILKLFGIEFTAKAILNFFVSSVKAAEDENEALRRLAFAVNSTGASFDRNSGSIVKWAKEIQETTRFSDDQAYVALGRLIKATNNLGQAQEAVTIAMNVSSASGKELSSVTEIIFDLINGQERAVRSARNEFGRFINATDTTKQALDKIQQKFKDAADSEESFSKNTAILKHNFDDLKEAIGTPLISALNSLMKSMIVPKDIDTVDKYIKQLEEAGHEVEPELLALRDSLKETEKQMKMLGIATKNIKPPKIDAKSTQKELEALNKLKEEIEKRYLDKVIQINNEYDEKKREAQLKELNFTKDLGEQTAGELGKGFSQAFSKAIVEGKSFEDAMSQVFTHVIEMIIEAILQMVIFRTLASAGMGGGTFMGFLPWGAGGAARGAASMGAGGGSGESGGTNIYVNLSTQSLNLDDRHAVMVALADEIAKKTSAARQFSSRIVNLANKNAGRAV